MRQLGQHASGQQYAGEVNEVKGAQHLQPRQQQASAAMHKTDGREQRTTAEDGRGDGQCACGPRHSSEGARNAQQEQRHQQTRILKPLPAGEEEIRPAEGRLVVSKAGVRVARGHENDGAQQPCECGKQAKGAPHPAPGKRER